jgi:hypothetical protein
MIIIKHCSSARYTYAANMAVDKDLDIIALGTVFLSFIYTPNG